MGNIRQPAERKAKNNNKSQKAVEQKTTLGKITAPEPIHENHKAEGFSCGEDALDSWLLRNGLHNHQNKYSNVYVCCDEHQHVVAYYTLSAYAIERKKISIQNAPNPVPAVLLGRLAVDRKYQGLGLGEDLLRDALLRIVGSSVDIGMHCVVVHAKNDNAVRFYKKYGFENIPKETFELFIPVNDIRENIISS